MKTIQQIIEKWNMVHEAISEDSNYHVYSHAGYDGILTHADNVTDPDRFFDDGAQTVFVPCEDLESSIIDKNITPLGTTDDSYSDYSYGEITDTRCVNPEYEQGLIYGWWHKEYAESDRYVRELLTITNSYYNWTSERSRMADRLEDILTGEGSAESMRRQLARAKQDWEETCSQYSDPLGYADMSGDEGATADFGNVLSYALVGCDATDAGLEAAQDYLQDK